LFYTSNAIAMILILLSWLYFTSPLIKPKQTQTIALVLNNQRSRLAWGCWLWWAIAINITENCWRSQSEGWN